MSYDLISSLGLRIKDISNEELEDLYSNLDAKYKEYADEIIIKYRSKEYLNSIKRNLAIHAIELELRKFNNEFNQIIDEVGNNTTSILLFLLSKGLNFAVSRYSKIEKLSVMYKAAIRHSSFVYNNILRFLTLVNNVKIGNNESNQILEKINQIQNYKCSAYEKVSYIYNFIEDKYLPADFAQKTINLKYMREFLSSIRLFFLRREILTYIEMLKDNRKNDVESLLINYYGNFKINDSLSKQERTQYLKKKTSMLYFYPKFMRSIIEDLINNNEVDIISLRERINKGYYDFLYDLYEFRSENKIQYNHSKRLTSAFIV